MDPKQIENLFHYIDSNKSGTVSISEMKYLIMDEK